MKPWTKFTREDYLLMIDRQWPFWTALSEFIIANSIKRVFEVGCGIGHSCFHVDSYVGIDVNKQVLASNELFYRRGEWICKDWMDMDAPTRPCDLFLAATTLEHCNTPIGFINKMLGCQWKYAVVTIPERLRTHVVESWDGDCPIYNLPVSRRPQQVQKVSAIVIDRTNRAKLDMWTKRVL